MPQQRCPVRVAHRYRVRMRLRPPGLCRPGSRPGCPGGMGGRPAGPNHRQGRVLVHVIADQATVDGRDNQPAFMDGHGVISAAHLRDLLARDDVRVRPLNPQSGEQGTDALPPICRRTRTVPPPPWTPSSGPATAIAPSPGVINRPGNATHRPRAGVRPRQPRRGWHTSPDELGTKCRMHHNFKTSPTAGRRPIPRQQWLPCLRSRVTEGIRFPGPAETNTDLFPSLTTSPGTSPRPIRYSVPFVAATDH